MCLLYPCLCTDFTGFVCTYTSKQHLESIYLKRFFFKRPLDCYGSLLALPCALITMELLHFSVELFTFLSVSVLIMLCKLLNANADQWCLCVLMCETSSSIIPPSACLVSMMHQQSAAPHYSSAQAGGQHYQGQQAMGMMGQGSQGNSMMSQRPMGSYRSSQQGRWSTTSSFVWRWAQWRCVCCVWVLMCD